MQNYFNWHSNCPQFIINLLFAKLPPQLAFYLPAIYNQCFLCNTTTSTGIQIAYNLQSVALASKFNWHSNCLQFAICCSFLQLQLAFKLRVDYNELAFCNTTTSTGIQIAYNLQSVALASNFNWHSNCLQFTMNLLFAKLLQLAFKLPATYNPLLLPTTSTGIPTACNLQSVALCLQLLLVFKCLQFAIRLLFAYNYYWRSNCPQICNLFALCLQLTFRNSILGLASASCTMPPKGKLLHSQIICEPSHATNCILSARHALILMLLPYSDPVQAFENDILTIYSETHLII